MNKIIVSVIIVLAVLVGAIFLFSGDDVTVDNNADIPAGGNSVVSGSAGEIENPPIGEAKRFVVTGENYLFMMDGVQNPDLVVNEGDMVIVEFSSISGLHDFVVDELGVATEKVRVEDGITTVEFIADKKGSFEYYCSVGQHRANGMEGNFIVQ